MKKHLIAFTFLFLAGVVVGCSDVGFNSIPKLSCDDVARDQNTNCFASPDTVTVSFTFGVGDVDILFVDDNSGSMFAEQRKMANAFPNFLNRISKLFYQIAIITTDVSSSSNNVKKAANGNGAYQDGRFLEFTDHNKTPSGLYVVDQNTPNVDDLFENTIQRMESVTCDGSGFDPQHCPSDDERGIYAANLAVERGDKNFFRSGAHLAIVVLSDEDERSRAGVAGYPPLELQDLPTTLVSTMKKYYPTKSFSVHSVVTNDESCRKQQTQSSITSVWPTLGFIGTQYMALSNPDASLTSLGNIQPGVVGSICAADYGAQLGNIGANISNNTMNSPRRLACAPDANSIKLVTNPTGYEQQVQYQIDSSNNIYFYNLPLGVKVTFSYDCPRF